MEETVDLWANLMDDRSRWAASANEDQDETRTRKGPWTVEEDTELIRYIRLHGEGRWSFLAKATGLKRTGKTCRLRWINYLPPDLKRGKITHEEECLIKELHGRLGNRWSRIARSLPGRTDNDIKNYWRTRITKNINLQAMSSSRTIDTENQEDFQRSSANSYCLTASSQGPSVLNNAEPLTSFPRKNTEKIEVQMNRIPYLQEDISSQESPVSEANYVYGLQGEIHDPRINDAGQPGAAQQEHSEGSDNLFENRLPYNFSMGTLATDLLPYKFFADDATEVIPHCSSYIVASPEAFSDSDSYLDCYSDVLWNMDEEDNPFIRNQHSGSRDNLRSL